jgi:hypothetical protein
MHYNSELLFITSHYSFSSKLLSLQVSSGGSLFNFITPDKQNFFNHSTSQSLIQRRTRLLRCAHNSSANFYFVATRARRVAR